MKRSRQQKQRKREWLQQLQQIDEDYFKFVRERIKEARKERGFTQAQLGKAIHKSGAIVSDLERGRTQVNAADLMRIAHVLEKPIKYFFPIRQVPSEEELTTDEWEIVLQFRKLDNHPDLRKLLMAEAKKFAELAQTKETGIGIMLMEDLIKQRENTLDQDPIDLKQLKEMLDRAKRVI